MFYMDFISNGQNQRDKGMIEKVIIRLNMQRIVGE